MIFHSIPSQAHPLPEKMNNPFYYEVHPLCHAICRQLQAELTERQDWREEIDCGKMFGVLIVDTGEEVGYLAAYSGQIGGRSDWDGFVPAVFDYLQPDGYFKQHEAEISHINQRIAQLENDASMKHTAQLIAQLQKTREEAITSYKEKCAEAKARRDQLRQEGNLSEEEEKALIKESQFMKAELRRLKKSLTEPTELERSYTAYQEEMTQLRQLRHQLSDYLQEWLFSQFHMLNALGEERTLIDIFASQTPYALPPAGSGECCEPKLLQYAYQHGWKPLQIAMFWWGESPKEEIRHHLHYYPACHGKCKPILGWMLPEAMAHIYNKVEKELQLLYEDDQLAVVCKPAGMLSVPGKQEAPSVYSLARKMFPHAEGPLIVHRLDMDTSGIMVIAKTEFSYRHLQDQFVRHTVQKRYIALVCPVGNTLPASGNISLPLMPDLLDRPRQKVSFSHGKEAVTEYQVVEQKKDSIKLALFPHTGRTHQLRVHCAHRQGLNAPILGDPLYGNRPASRLYLHAEAIDFRHPLTGKAMHIEAPCDF